jgi:phage tail sheath protein FI
MAEDPRKITLKNTKQQSYYVNLVSGGAQKIGARDVVEIDEADLQSSELIFHLNRGDLVIVDRPAAPAPGVATPPGTPPGELQAGPTEPSGAAQPPQARRSARPGRPTLPAEPSGEAQPPQGTLMPEYLSPGVYVEEVSGGIKPIEGVGTSTGAFIGVAARGPVAGAQYEDGPGRPVLITNFTEFTRTFGSVMPGEFLAYAVQQFFGEGGTRCYVARTAHFTDPADPATLTAQRATVPLTGGLVTTLTADVAAGATQLPLASAAGLNVGMHLLITGTAARARVRVTNLPGGNAVDVANTIVDAAGNPVSLPALNNGASVTQVILDVNAIDEGEWGNTPRVAVTVAGRLLTTLSAAVAAGATQATLASVAGITPGLVLFIDDGTTAARVQVTRVDAAQNQITFVPREPTPTPALNNGANVHGVILGKASTVLDGAVAAGATEATVLSTEGLEVGSILLLTSETVTPRARAADRVVVTQIVGQRIVFTPALSVAFPDRSRVSTEDFTLIVYDRDDVVETFPNLSMEDSNATDYVQVRINQSATRSRYMRTREAPLTAGNLPPMRTAAPLRLTGGTNGTTDEQGDYIGNQAAQTGFFAFDTVDDINVLAAPGITFRPVILAGMTYCENRGDCFFVGDAPLAAQTVTQVLDFKNATGEFAGQQALVSKYGALYWPWIRILDLSTNRLLSMPPSGAVIGSYSATDVRRGVHKAPAGIDDGFLNTAIGVEKVVTKGEHDLLNPQGVNVIRTLPDIGIVIWGARTTSSDPEWRYINVRRLFLFLEESIYKGTQWAVFEPNDEVLWKRIVRNVSAFLRVQWLEGKLVGEKPEQAFFVKCDAETNPPESVDLGRVITLIGVAPSKPAEFVIFRIMQARPGSAAAA